MIYDEFEKWKSKYMPEYKLSNSKFITTLYNLDIVGVSKGRHTKKGNTIYIDMEAIKQYLELDKLEEFEDMCECCYKTLCSCVDDEEEKC